MVCVCACMRLYVCVGIPVCVCTCLCVSVFSHGSMGTCQVEAREGVEEGFIPGLGRQETSAPGSSPSREGLAE